MQPLSVTHPELAKEADGWDPTLLTYGSGKLVSWKCSLGHKWNAKLVDRSSKSSGCPFCSGNRVLVGFNDLRTSHPSIASEADGWDPSTISGGSSRKVDWVCILGHKWVASVHSRATHGTSCPTCSGNRVEVGINDLSTTDPTIALLAYGRNPNTVSRGNRSKKQWKCEKGHIFSSAPNSLTSRSTSGCPYCAGVKVLDGFNDLKTTHPALAEQAFGWSPKLYSAGSVTKLKWICDSSHTWTTSINSRTSNNTGCPTCAESGFDPNKAAFLYFLSHPTWEMYQIGITNFPDDRLGSHVKLGWELLELRGPMDGHLTQQWETAILRMLKATGADLSNAAIAGKFDGYSEAWSRSTFEVKTIKELMRLTEKFEELNTLSNDDQMK
jgi:hypothetical protein